MSLYNRHMYIKRLQIKGGVNVSKVLDTFLNEQISDLKSRGLYNEIETVEGANGPVITISGKKLINLSSNNYLGLATDERLKKVAKEAVDVYGVGAGAVRTINGTLDLHNKLEETLAKFKGTEAVISFQSGFNCNMADRKSTRLNSSHVAISYAV